MKTLNIVSSRPYSVHIGAGLLRDCGSFLKTLGKRGKVMIVCGTNVDPLYSLTVCGSLRDSGFRVDRFVFRAGEASKNPNTLLSLLNAMAEAKLTRSDTVLALGGGVCGDLAGLAASLYCRGISFINIPTTLLAMVDSCIGGKTAVDLPAGKNLMGSFYPPELVIIDTDTLSTLPECEIVNGSAEVIKYAVLKNPALLELLHELDREDLIYECLSVKADYVAGDERDLGKRQFLNFGHTFGHAIEAASGYTLSHGEAVAIGMVIATRYAVRTKLCKPDCLDSLLTALEAAKLPTSTEYELSALLPYLLIDKKRRENEITFVLPVRLGECVLKTFPVTQLPEAFL